MRGRGVEVLLFHDLLSETLERDAREWVLERRLRPEQVTALFTREMTLIVNVGPLDFCTLRGAGQHGTVRFTFSSSRAGIDPAPGEDEVVTASSEAGSPTRGDPRAN